MTAAADELVVTQPSVSSALAALSRELDCELFERATLAWLQRRSAPALRHAGQFRNAGRVRSFGHPPQ